MKKMILARGGCLCFEKKTELNWTRLLCFLLLWLGKQLCQPGVVKQQRKKEKKGMGERATESTMVLGDEAQSKKEERKKKRKGKSGRIGVQ